MEPVQVEVVGEASEAVLKRRQVAVLNVTVTVRNESPVGQCCSDAAVLKKFELHFR